MTVSGRRRGSIWSFALAALITGCGGSKSEKPSGNGGSGGPGGVGGMDESGANDGGSDDATDAAGDGAPPSDGPALPACASLVNPLYIMGGDTQVPILKTLGKALRQDASPVTLVWQATGSCTIIDAVYNGTPLKQNLSYIPDDPAWDPSSGTVPTCTPDAAGAPVQVGIPIVFPESCTSQAAPSGVKSFKGPVQSFVFVVPTVNSAQAISAEEAYMVFGFGATGGVSPWIDPMFYFVRPATKGTQVSLGAVIGVPAARWKGQKIDQSTAVASMVAASTAPDKTIGILGAEIYDSATNRAAMRALSFEAFGQMGGYLPDTTPTSFDKRNVRDGHYAAWSHVFYLTAVDGSGVATDANARRLIDILAAASNAAAPTGIDPLTLLATKGLVPLCAMTVQRALEGGPIYRSQPTTPCGCFYESIVSTAPPTCTACSTTAPCAGLGVQCLHGFCEAADGRTSLADCASPPANDEQIPNFPCSGRSVAPQRPLPPKVVDNGGTLPMLP